jgi:hypothetical protein
VPARLAVCLLSLLALLRPGTAAAAEKPYVGPPRVEQVGPRKALQQRQGGQLPAGTYAGLRFTTPVSLSSRSGSYSFTDCELAQGFGAIFGGPGITRTVTVDHSRIMGGLYFEDGGQKGWTITWCHLLGETQALRPKGLTFGDTLTPTPFTIQDSICEIVGKGTPSAHCEAMQSLGGNGMTFRRVRFITPGPYVNGTTGQTASVNHAGGDTLFEECEFLTAGAFHFTVYSVGRNVVFRDCRLARGITGYLYPPAAEPPTLEGCTDLETGDPVR